MRGAALDRFIRYTCPFCGLVGRIQGSQAGRPITCAGCAGSIRLLAPTQTTEHGPAVWRPKPAKPKSWLRASQAARLALLEARAQAPLEAPKRAPLRGWNAPLDDSPAPDSPQTKLRFPCPGCGHMLRASKAAAGRHGRCPACQARCRVPGGAGAKVKPAPTRAPRDPWESAASDRLTLHTPCQRPGDWPGRSAPQPASRGPRPALLAASEPERRHLHVAERHVQALGALGVLGTLAPLVLVNLILLIALLSLGKADLTTLLATAGARLGLVGAGAVAVLGPGLVVMGWQLAVGLGLRRYQAWARWAATAGAGLHLLACASLTFVSLFHAQLLGSVLWIGLSAWPAFKLWVLHNSAAPEVFSPPYRQQCDRSPDVSVAWISSPVFVVPALVTAVVLACALVAVL